MAHGVCGHGILCPRESLRVTDHRKVAREMQRYAQNHEEHKESKKREEVYLGLGMARYSWVLVQVQAEVVREWPEALYMWTAWSASCSNTDDLGLIRATLRGYRGSW